MEFSLRFVVSLMIGVLVLLAIVVLLQQNAGTFEGFMGEFVDFS